MGRTVINFSVKANCVTQQFSAQKLPGMGGQKPLTSPVFAEDLDQQQQPPKQPPLQHQSTVMPQNPIPLPNQLHNFINQESIQQM